MTHRVPSLALVPALALVAFVACDKPASTVPPPGDTAGAPADGGAADGGAADGGAADGGAADGGGTEPGSPDVAWKDKTFDQKKEFMGVEVFPKMKAAFQGYDANQFRAFKCDTCHGPDPAAKKYKMPTDSIYPLPKDNPVKAAMAYDEKMTKFMVDTIVPEMAKMLQMQPADPKTGLGEFGCMNCHPAE